MGQNKVVLGIDFGSSAVRILTMDLISGSVISTVEQAYSHGENGIYLSSQNNLLARQKADDYIQSLEKAFKKATDVNQSLGIQMSTVKGIGVDATGSTPLPVTKDLTALSSLELFQDNLNAYAWMWKDHCAHQEALQITNTCKTLRPHYLDKIGGAYSSEWFWAKILHCQQTDKEVFDAAYTWLELSDYIPALLSGISDAHQVNRNICAAGHKGLYNEEWGGFPDEEFIAALHPDLLRILNTLPQQTYSTNEISGYLSQYWADKLGLPAGIPIGMGILDAHAGAIGSGIKEGTLVKIIGTSTCDLVLSPLKTGNANVQGVASVAEESVLPNYYGIESGQSAVGDILDWFIKHVLKGQKSHTNLTAEAEKINVGSSGLLALDWNNGNRCILSDPMLSGLLLGQNLQTQDYEIYRALIESTAFGARTIIEDLERQGVIINEVVNCGGITHKNPLFMQIYADVINKPMKIAASNETVALGAAIIAAHAANKNNQESCSFNQLQEKSCKMSDKIYYPIKENVIVYNQLFALYSKLHDAFGRDNSKVALYDIMKELIQIKNKSIENE